MKKIWASGVVKRVADGSYKRSAACKNFLEAGAVLCAWEADPARKEKAGEQWLVLKPGQWNRHVRYGWRYDPCELDPSRSTAPRTDPVITDRSDEDYEHDYLADEEVCEMGARSQVAWQTWSSEARRVNACNILDIQVKFSLLCGWY